MLFSKAFQKRRDVGDHRCRGGQLAGRCRWQCLGLEDDLVEPICSPFTRTIQSLRGQAPKPQAANLRQWLSRFTEDGDICRHRVGVVGPNSGVAPKSSTRNREYLQSIQPHWDVGIVVAHTAGETRGYHLEAGVKQRGVKETETRHLQALRHAHARQRLVFAAPQRFNTTERRTELQTAATKSLIMLFGGHPLGHA